MNILSIILALTTLLTVSCSPDRSSYRDYEDGYYIGTEDSKLSYFCKQYYTNTSGVVGMYCKDMTCKVAANKLATIERVILKEGVVFETKNFQYKLLSCGK